MTRDPIDTDQDWVEREVYWRRRLRRLHFGAEPLTVQVERHRRATLGVSMVSAAIAAMFLVIFSAFGRPDVGAIVDLVLIAPIVGLAWLDFGLLARRVRAYEAEKKKATDQARVPADSG